MHVSVFVNCMYIHYGSPYLKSNAYSFMFLFIFTCTYTHILIDRQKDIIVRKYLCSIYLSLCIHIFMPMHKSTWTFLVAQMVKNLPGMQETWVQSLVQEDILKKEIVIHSTILSWRIPWTEDLGGP